MKKYLVTFVTYKRTGPADYEYTDHYEAFDSMEEAEVRYEKVVNSHKTWTANISKVLKSTDYEIERTQNEKEI